ncbi:MAG: hypothetical protein K0S49_2556 [Microbacterium sp.]|jgi:hypothetical protein|nr:hypothetical protein [Microbacterium sp.]
MLHPLMYEVLLPDSREVSRDAAARYAFITARKEAGLTGRARLRAWRLRLGALRLRLRALPVRLETGQVRPVAKS